MAKRRAAVPLTRSQVLNLLCRACDADLSSKITVAYQSINQSINVKFVGRRYTRRPGAPTVVSGTHDQKVHS